MISEVQIFALNKNFKNMYSNEDLERFYFKYQPAALPHGQSLQSFFLNNKVLTYSTQQLISFWK